MKRLLAVLLLAAIGAVAQVATVPNSDFPTFRTNLNNSLGNAASITGSYGNPTWITSLAASKLTGLFYQTVKVGGAAATQRPTINFIQGTNITFTCADNAGSIQTDCTISATAGAGGYATLQSNGSSVTTRTVANFSTEFTVVDNSGAGRTDISIAGVDAARIISGALVKARQHAATVYTDQANTFSTGVQDLSAATNLRVPNVSGYTPTLNGHFGFDTSTSTYKGYVGAAVKTFAFLDSNITGNAATATALAATPTKCSAGNYPLGVDAGGNAQNCTAAGSGAANQTCTFISSASSCSITYTTALSDAAIASDPFCVYTDVTPNVGFLAGSWTKSTTALAVNFSPATTRPGKCSVNTSGGGGGGGGTPGGVNGQLQINSSGAFGGRTIGPGLTDDGTAVKLDTLAVRTFLPGSASLTHGVITAGNCASQDITVTGASLGDRVVLGAPAEIMSFTLSIQYGVINANTVRIRLCNFTGSSITPTAAITWNVDVVKAF